jgi:hypothetical protein
MELLAVRLARLIVFFPTDELNPDGRRLLDNFLPAFIERYDFRKYPEKPDEFDEEKGVKFELGRWQDSVINQLILYNNGILVDTMSSTDNAEAMLKDAMTWAAESFKLQYRPDMLSRKAYVSEVLFRSEVTLEALNPALKELWERLSKYLSKREDNTLSVEPIGIVCGVDTLKIKIPPATFRVERLAETPFSEMKYYSQAPLPTDEHIKFLQDFEAALKSKKIGDKEQ